MKIRRIIFRIFLSVYSALAVLSCVESGGSGGNTTTLPDVDAQCPLSTCPSSSSAQLYIGFVSGDVDCRALLQTLNSTNTFSLNFDAWNVVEAPFEDGGFQRGFVTSWFDSNDGDVQQLDNGTYTACGFYDQDGDDFLDDGEGFAEEMTSLEVDGTYLFISWDSN